MTLDPQAEQENPAPDAETVTVSGPGALGAAKSRIVRATSIEAHPRGWRWVLAGPVAILLAILSMAALPAALPQGRGGVDHLVLPVMLFPLLWSLFLVWPVSTDRLRRCAITYGVLCVAFITLILLQFLL